MSAITMVLAMMNNKYFNIKPCPYCGGRAYIDIVSDMPFVNAHHTKKCKVRPNTWLLAIKFSLKKQIKAWNLREGDNGD